MCCTSIVVHTTGRRFIKVVANSIILMLVPVLLSFENSRLVLIFSLLFSHIEYCKSDVVAFL